MSIIKKVSPEEVCIVERFSKFHSIWESGIHFKLPFVEKIVKTVSLKENIINYPQQYAFTKDGVKIQLDATIFFTVVDPKIFTYDVEMPHVALETLVGHTLRDIVGEMKVNYVTTSQSAINVEAYSALSNLTQSLGIKVNRVEVNIVPPAKEIQEKFNL